MHGWGLDPAPLSDIAGQLNPYRILASDVPPVPNNTSELEQGLHSSKLRPAAHVTNEVGTALPSV